MAVTLRTLRQMMDGKTARSVRRGVMIGGTAFFARSLQQITTFVLTILAARFLVPAEYGVYTLAVVFVTLIQTLTYTGYFQFIVTRKGDEKALLDTSFWMIVLGSTLGSSALLLGAPTISGLYGAPDLESVLILLAVVQPFSAMTAWCSAVLMRQNRMQTNFNIMIVQNLGAMAAGVTLLVLWKSLFALVAYRYVRIVLGAALYLLFTRTRPGFRVRGSVAREATSYASALYGSRVLTFFSNYGADLVLGLLFSTAEAGLYRFGNRLATASIDIVAQPMRAFALAQLGAANRDDKPFGDVVERFAPTMLLLTGGVAAAVMVFCGGVIELFLQPSYLAATVVTYALAVRGVATLGVGLVEPVLSARGRTGIAMAFAAGAAAVELTGVLIAAPFGLGALAWTQTTLAAVASAAGFVLIGRVGQVDLLPVISRLGKAAVGLVAYGLLAYSGWHLVQAEFGLDKASFVAGVSMAGLLGVLLLLVTTYLRLFSLRVFSD